MTLEKSMIKWGAAGLGVGIVVSSQLGLSEHINRLKEVYDMNTYYSEAIRYGVDNFAKGAITGVLSAVGRGIYHAYQRLRG
jgi:hypothetical protein